MTKRDREPGHARADAAALPPKLRGIVGNTERVERAAELLMAYSPRQAARKLSAETGLGFDRAEDYVEGALLLMARSEGLLSVAERRAVLLAKTQAIYRRALKRQRSLATRDGVKAVPDPDLRAANAALELEARLYGVFPDAVAARRRAIALVLEVARDCMQPEPYHALVLGLARAAGHDGHAEASLPARSDEM